MEGRGGSLNRCVSSLSAATFSAMLVILLLLSSAEGFGLPPTTGGRLLQQISGEQMDMRCVLSPFDHQWVRLPLLVGGRGEQTVVRGRF